MSKAIICSKCGKEKVHHAKGMCRKCYIKCYTQDHKRERSKYMRKYYQDHRKELLAYYHKQNLKYNREHSEKKLKINEEWHKSNPERVKLLHKISNAKRRSALTESFDSNEWLQRQKPFICFYCNKAVGEAHHIDHFIPLSKGGVHSEANLRISCPNCNLRKKAKLPWEFMPERFSPEISLKGKLCQRNQP